jgi:hypothetical protein
MTSTFSLDLSVRGHKIEPVRIKLPFFVAQRNAAKRIVLMGGELVFLASANTTAGETVPL